MTPRVLLVGYTSSNTPAEIPSVFAKAGCTVELFCFEDSWLRKGSHGRMWHRVTSKEPKAYIAQLLELVAHSAYDWVVPVDDAVLRLLAGAGEAARALVPLSKPESLPLLGSKAGLSRLCAAQGIPTPAYAVHGEVEIGALAEEVGYPLLMKMDKSEAGRGVFYCADEAAVREQLAALSREAQRGLVFQAYIAGDNISVEALHKHGCLCAYAPSLVVGTLGGEFGVSTERRYGPFVPAQLVEMIGERLGLNGFSSMTFLRNATDGRLYLVEVDARPQAWVRLTEQVGVDFAQAVRVFLGLQAVDSLPVVPDGRAWHFYRDVRRCIARGDLAGLWAWVRNKDGRWRFAPWYDKRLFAAVSLQLVGYVLRLPFYKIYALVRK